MEPTTAPIFVVAAPCAGTGLLMKLLRTVENVRTLDASQRVAAVHVVEGEGDSLGARLQKLYGGPHRMVSAASHHALSIAQLREAFPMARFIYLHRNAADQMSQALHGMLSGKAPAAGELRGWAARARQAQGDAGFQRLDLEDIVALRWSFYTATILNDLALLPPEVRCAVSYEDLLDDPMRICAQLGSFAGLQVSHSPLAMAGYRQHLRRQADVPKCTPAPWTSTLIEQAAAFTREAHPVSSRSMTQEATVVAKAAPGRNQARRGAFLAGRFGSTGECVAPALASSQVRRARQASGK